MQYLDLYLTSFFLVIVIAYFLYVFFKDKNKEKRWAFFIAQVFLTTTSGVMIANINFNKMNEIFKGNTMILSIMMIIGSWVLFYAIFKFVYGHLSIKFNNRKDFIKYSNLFLIIAILLFFIQTENNFVLITIFIIQAILIGACLGVQSSYFLYFNEQKFNKNFPLKVSFILGTTISLAYLTSNLLISLVHIVPSDAYFIELYAPIVLVIISFILSFFLKEYPDKIGGFSNRIIHQMAPYKKNILVKMIILTITLSIIYTTLQSPFIKMYIIAELKSKGASCYFLNAIDRQYTIMFFVPHLILGYIIFKIFNNKINLNYALILVLGLMSLTLLVNTFYLNAILLIISNIIFGSVLFTLMYFWMSFALMWNSRAKQKPILGWVTGSFVLSQFLITTLFNYVILLDNSIFIVKSTSEIISAELINLENFKNKLSIFLKLVFAIMFMVNCIYIIMVFMWSKTIIAEYQDVNFMVQKMYKIEKQSIEDKINKRMVED
ncbi:hypothetical protein EELLY_v1c03360 [Entomoplasma ellychniae]|uniref:MFS transporter n=1 Tax=Entomoplasma ellychniae TaxID=2114 RepID=A0A8E2QVW6_9MOLU|nr:hypothetical protein [Entomoplasma ellychniae]PPE04656.1 hypothetical protein EELLY_v1c03360 [Entomoplasma ellychniae]